jgi:hypothetical protein
MPLPKPSRLAGRVPVSPTGPPGNSDRQPAATLAEPDGDQSRCRIDGLPPSVYLRYHGRAADPSLVPLEAEARAAHRGLWGLQCFQPPGDFRRHMPNTCE